MGVDEDRGRSSGAHHLGIPAGGEHGALEVHVHVDEPWRDVAAGAVKQIGGVGTGSRWVNAGHHWANHPNVGLAQLPCSHVDHGAAGQDQVESLVAERGRDSSGAGLLVEITLHEQTLARRGSSAEWTAGSSRRDGPMVRTTVTLRCGF